MPEDVGQFVVGAVAVGAGIFVSTLSFGLASPLGGALIGYGAGMISQSLRGAPDPEGQQTNVAKTDAAIPIIYGRQKVGLKILETWVDPDSSDREQLIRAGVLCVASEDGSGVEDIRRVWLDDTLAIDPVTTTTGSGSTGIFTGSWHIGGIQSFFDGHMGYAALPGTDGQTAPQALQDHSTTRYPDDFRNRGLAWIALVMEKDKEVFPRIPNITVEVDGNHVYDPRDSSWKFSNNPALCLLDYLTSARYGADLFYPERDGGDTSLSEIDEQSFIDAANYCEEQVQDGSGGTQDRFTFDGLLNSGTAIGDNVGVLLAAMRGGLVYQNGKFRLIIRQSKSSVKTLTEDEIIGDWKFRRGGSRKVPNKIVAKYNGGQSGDTSEEVEWPEAGDTTFLDQDGGHRQTMETTLMGVQDAVRAQQIAMVMLKEAREDVAVQVTVRMSASDLEVGDVVTIDHATPGWTGSSTKDFWVAEMQTVADPEQGGEKIRLTLKEYSANAYSLDPQTRPTPPPGSNLPDPTSTGAPTNLSLTSDNTTQLTTPSGDKVAGILVTWDLPLDKGIDRVVVLERENGTSNWNTAAVVEPDDDQRAQFHPKGSSEGDTWEVGIYALVGQRLLKSSTVTGTVTLSTDYSPGDSSDAIEPDAGLREDARDPTSIDFDLFVESGSDISNPDLRFRYRLLRGSFAGTWSSWTSVADASDGTWIDKAITGVSRAGKHPRMLEVQVQDEAPASSPSTRAFHPVMPQLDGIDDGSGGRVDPGTPTSSGGGVYEKPSATDPDDDRSILRSATSGAVADAIQKLLDSGKAEREFTVGGHPVFRHPEAGSGQDGNAQGYGDSYDQVPNVNFIPQVGVSYDHNNSGVSQKMDMQDQNPSVSGFDLRARLVTSVQTTAIDDGFGEDPSDGSGGGGETISADGAVSHSNLEDANSTPVKYTVTYDVDTSTMDSDVLLTVHVEVNDGATSSSWSEVASAGYDSEVGNVDDEQLSFNTGLGQDFDIRIRITYGPTTPSSTAVVYCHGEGDAIPGVQYNRDDGTASLDMTPDSGDEIAWFAREKS